MNKQVEIEYKCGDVVEVVRGYFPISEKSPLRGYLRKKRGKRTGDSPPGSVSRMKNRIRRLVNSNVTGKDVLITLTYEENMIDEKIARKDWKAFLHRLRYHLPFADKYLYVVERQRRGAFHFHFILFSVEDRIVDDIIKLWGKGSIDVTSLYDIANVGAYISSEMGKEYQKKGVLGRRWGKSRNLSEYNKKTFAQSKERPSRLLVKDQVVAHPAVGNIQIQVYSHKSTVEGFGEDFINVPF